MKYKAIDLLGKEVIGNYVIYEGLSLVLVSISDIGTTQTKIKPESLEELD
jgi:hypothetical protein